MINKSNHSDGRSDDKSDSRINLADNVNTNCSVNSDCNINSGENINKNIKGNLSSSWKEYAIAGSICVLLFVVLTHLGILWNSIGEFFSVILPLILGMVIAYIINPLAVLFDEKILKGIKKRKARWTISVVIALIVVFALIFILIASLIPQLIENIASLLDNMQYYISNVKELTASLDPEIQNAINNVIDNFAGDNGLFITVGEFFADNMSSIIEATGNVGTVAVNWLIGTVLAVYFLMAKHAIMRAFRRLFLLITKPESVEKKSAMLGKFNYIFTKYIICELIDAIIVGVINYVFMLIMGMPDALVISVVVGVTNLIPTFGPVIGAAIAVFILLLVQPAAILPFVIFTVILQIADGYVIKPKFFGNALNVPGVIILAAIIVFGRLMGVIGMLLAIPIAAVLVYIYENMFIEWLKLRRKGKNETMIETMIAETKEAAENNIDEE